MEMTFDATHDIESYFRQSTILMSILDEENEKYITLEEASKRQNYIDLDILAYESEIMRKISPELSSYSTPKLESIMDKAKGKDDSLSQSFDTIDKDRIIGEIHDVASKGLYSENSRAHNIGHIERVVLFSELIGKEELKNEEGIVDEHAIDLLRKSALYHDCGRRNDYSDEDHGLRSALIAGELLKNEGYSEEDISIIEIAIEYHEVVDDYLRFESLCNKHGISEDKFEYVKKIANCLKDADALDRTRFRNSAATLNPNMLRTETSKGLVDTATKLNARYREINKELFKDICVERIMQEGHSLSTNMEETYRGR